MKHILRGGCLLLASGIAHLCVGAPGDLRWQLHLGTFINGAPALSTMGDLLVPSDGRLHAVSTNGVVQWTFETPRGNVAGPTVADDGTIYFGADSVYALDPHGSRLWRYAESELSTGPYHYFSDPVIGPDGAVYVTRISSGEERLFALNPDGTMRWVVKSWFGTPPIIAEDSTIYIVRRNADLFAVNPDGVIRWVQGLDYRRVLSPPTLMPGGTVLVSVSDGSIPSSAGVLYAVNADGSVQWSYEGEAAVSGSAVLGTDGTIYVGFDSGRVVALSTNGSPISQYQIENMADTYPNVWSPALAADGTLYVTGERWLHALDSNGQLLWRFDTGHSYLGPPLIGNDGTVYFGTGGGTGILYAVEGTGAPLASSAWPMAGRNARHRASLAFPLNVPVAPTNLTATTNTHTDSIFVRWDSVIGATHYRLLRGQAPDLAGAEVLVEALTGTNGFADRSADPGVNYYYHVQARNSAGLSPASGPVQGRRRVALVGEPVWIFPTADSINGAPAIAPDGTILFTSADGYLYATDGDGNEKWRFRYGTRYSSAPGIGSDGSIYFRGSSMPDPGSNTVFCLSSDGNLRWQIPLIGSMSGLAIGADGTIYLTSGNQYTTEQPAVRAFSSDGSNVWNYGDGLGFRHTPAIGPDGAIYAGTEQGTLVALSPDGDLIWKCETGGIWLTPPVIDGDGVLFTSGEELYAINSDGQRLWSHSFQSRSEAGPSSLDTLGKLLIQADDTFYELDRDGTNVRKFTLPEFRDRAITHVIRDAAETTYVSAFDGYTWGDFVGKIYAISTAGDKEWEYIRYRVSFSDATLATNNLLLVMGSDGLYALRTAAGPNNSAWPQILHDAQHTARATQIPPIPSVPLASATQRTRVTDVRVSWHSVLSASGYKIFRSGSTNPAEAVLLAELTGRLFFDDNTAAPEIAYTYWVCATNVSGASTLSEPTSGMRRQAVPGELLYEWDVNGKVDTAPAVAEDGTIYVSVNQPVNAPDPRRKVVALRPDGTIRWEYLIGQGLLGAPTIGTNGMIYVVTRFSFSSPLLALTPDGSFAWEFVAAGPVTATPVLGADGTIYLGSEEGNLYALDPAGALKWSITLTNGIGSIAAGRDGTLFMSLGSGRLAAVRNDGTPLWNVAAGSLTLGGSPVAGLAIDLQGRILLSCGGNGIKAFNPDGTTNWHNASPGTFSSTPAIGIGGSIIVGAYDGVLHFLDSNGTNLWRTNSGGYYSRSAAAVSASGAVYAGNGAGRLTAYSHTAQKLWEYAAGSVLSSPTIAPDGTIYVGTAGGNVISVFGAGGPADTAWPMFQRDAQHTGRDRTPPALPALVTNVAAGEGTFNDRVRVSWTTAPGATFYEVWRHTQADLDSATLVAGSVAGQTFFDDKEVVAGTNYFYWVRSMNALGAAAFSQPDAGFRRIAVPGELLGNSRPLAAVTTSPALGVEGRIYAGGSGRLYALNPDLTKSWEFTRGSVSTPAVGSDGTLHFWCADGRFYALDTSATQLWSLPGMYEVAFPPALNADDTVVIAGRDRSVSCFDPETGSWRWQYWTSTNISAAPVVGADGALYFGTADGQLHALNPDGTLRWRFRAGARIQSSPTPGDDGIVYFGADDRVIYAVGPDGRRRWAAQAGDTVRASPVIGPDGAIVVGSLDRRLYVFNPDGTKRWDFLAESAIHASACVGADGTIYFGTYNGWVYALNSSGGREWTFNSATNSFSGSVLQSPLLLDDRLLVPIGSGSFGVSAIQAFSVRAGPPIVNWPQFRRDAHRTARAQTWLTFESPIPAELVAGETLRVAPRFDCPGRSISRVELWNGTNLVAFGSGTIALNWYGVPAGRQAVSLRVLDDSGQLHSSVTWNADVIPAPRIRIESASTGGWHLQLETLAGRNYQLERSSNLTDWLPLGNEITATNALQVWIEPDPLPGAAYYRVRLLP